MQNVHKEKKIQVLHFVIPKIQEQDMKSTWINGKVRNSLRFTKNKVRRHQFSLPKVCRFPSYQLRTQNDTETKIGFEHSTNFIDSQINYL